VTDTLPLVGVIMGSDSDLPVMQGAIEILEENFGDLVFQSRIKKAIKFAEAPVRGASVLKYDPKGKAATYYRDLAKEVISHE
jgi:chromosome partitioning protein